MTESRAGNIIIVEDNLLIATEIKKRLQRAGYNIIGSFESGEDLLADIEHLDPDIILMDIMLKGQLSGIDTTKLVVKKYDLPIIYLTAYSDKDTLNKAKETGPFAYLVKPVSKEDLVVNIEMALHNHRKKRRKDNLIITSSLDHLDDAIFITSDDSDIQYMNNTATELFKISNKDLKTIDNLLLNKIELNGSPDFIIKEKLKSLRNKFTHDIIINYDNKAGSLSITPVKDVNEKIVGRVYIVKLKDDIKIIKLLQESEERFRGVLENIQLMAFMMDREGNIFFCNDYFSKILGIKKDKLFNTNWFTYLAHKEDRDSLFKKYISKNKVDYQNHNSYKIATKEGTELTINWNNIPIKDKNSNVVGFTCIGEDITDKLKAEEELKKHQVHLERIIEERTQNLKEVNKKLTIEIKKHKITDEQNKYHLNFLETLIETAPTPIFIKDTSKKYIKCNKAFEKYFGFGENDILGKIEELILPKDLAQKVSKIEDELLLHGGEKSYEGKVINLKNEVKEFITTKSVFMKANNEIGGIIGVAVDVTEMKKLERNLEQSLKKEKELNELKSRFISTASHEFRTPLTSIITSADLLEMFGQNWDEKKYKSHIVKIQNSVGKMTELLEDVLAVNKGETHKLRFSPTKNNLKYFCMEITEEILNTYTPKQEIIFNFSTRTEYFFFDKELLRHALQNLLSNALKYSEAKTIITLDVYRKNGKIVISISDEGIGIPEEDLEIIFDPFYRSKNIGNISGTGLGLTIVKNVIDIHKGKLEVESSLNKGTQFKIILPITYE